MLDLYLEVLDDERLKIFKQLAPMAKYGVLAGGTALALQLGHRKSFDFDIFVSSEITPRIYKNLQEIFNYTLKEPRIRSSDILLTETSNNVEIHVVYIWYKRISQTMKTFSLELESIEDIAADKANTIGRRGQWRDYVDLFFMIKNNIFSLQKIIDLAKKKYVGEFNPRLFLEQLSFFDDINDFAITFLSKSYSVNEMQNFLVSQTKKSNLI